MQLQSKSRVFSAAQQRRPTASVAVRCALPALSLGHRLPQLTARNPASVSSARPPVSRMPLRVKAIAADASGGSSGAWDGGPEACLHGGARCYPMLCKGSLRAVHKLTGKDFQMKIPLLPRVLLQTRPFTRREACSTPLCWAACCEYAWSLRLGYLRRNRDAWVGHRNACLPQLKLCTA